MTLHFFNQNVSKAKYLRETGTSLILLQYLISRCKPALSSLFRCRVCRNRRLDTEQRVPKTERKSKMESVALKTYHRAWNTKLC